MILQEGFDFGWSLTTLEHGLAPELLDFNTAVGYLFVARISTEQDSLAAIALARTWCSNDDRARVPFARGCVVDGTTSFRDRSEHVIIKTLPLPLPLAKRVGPCAEGQSW